MSDTHLPFRWLYLLALLQLLGGPLVVSMVMGVGGESPSIAAFESGNCFGEIAALARESAQMAQGDLELGTESERRSSSTTKLKVKPKWSIVTAVEVRLVPPAGEVLRRVETAVRARGSGAGPPAPPPRWS